MILGVLTWATGGARWRLYAAGAVVAMTILGAMVWSWRASIRRDEGARLRAISTAQALARAMERAVNDDEIRRLPPAARRSRLRQWASADE